MQCTSFIPGFYSCRDLNVCDNGGVLTIYNCEKTLNNVHSRPLPTKHQFPLYEKKVLRQTILHHESIFRDQVRELHRLHRRQRELMDEIKRRMLSEQNLQSESAFLPKISSEAAQGRCQIPSLPWVNPTASRFSVSSTENFWSTLNFSEWSHFKCEKPNKKMFDLELPAEYNDSEEDQFGNKKVSKVSELPCYPTKGMEEVLQKSDVELFCCDPFPSRDYYLTDLNETLGHENAVTSNSLDLNMPPSGLLDSEISQQNLRTGVNQHENLQAVLPTPEEKMQSLRSKPNKEREDSPHKDSLYSRAFSTSICDPEPKRLKTSDACNYMENISVGVISMGVIAGSTISEFATKIDLNRCINEDESSPKLSVPVVTKTVEEMDLEAPVSPENKECSPPRGELEESSLETPVKLSKQEGDGDPQKNELVRMAAEAIVLMSTPRFPKLLLENIIGERLEGSSDDSLDWFAEVVSSLSGDLENEIGVVLGYEFSSDGSDYFQAMTLELMEMKVEELRCKCNVQKEEDTSGVLSPSKPRIGRVRGKQRKNLQAEVLPSLSSLSTEDLQTIGGMMEAAGFLVGTGPGRRNWGRNGCSRTRRHLGTSICNEFENTACSPLEQQNIDSSALGERSLKGWGKVNRRRRGPRIPSTSIPLVFGYAY